MNDLISRKALLAEYDRVHIGEPGGARKLMEDAPAVREWIPVSERLPEAHRLVLCRWTRGVGASYGFARYNHDINVWYVSNEGMPNVTHWMPLPEPPKT